MADTESKKPPVAGGEPNKSRDKTAPVPEAGGRNGPDPTRFGDWEKDGRCIDF